MSEPSSVDEDPVPCCYGVAVYGPERCTCWTPEYDKPQRNARVSVPVVRDRMCEDCAFRPGSPERSGDERFASSGEGELEESSPFFCHQGMRRVVRYVDRNEERIWRELRPPRPAEHDGCYAPLIRGGVAYKADGTPADLCAGWAASQRRRDEE